MKWQAPGDMREKIHSFDLRIGGGYDMSLYYPPAAKDVKGKTNDNEEDLACVLPSLLRERK